MYKLVFNNKEIELPKRTLEVEEIIQKTKKLAEQYGENSITVREFVEGMHSMAKYFLNNEQITELLGTNELMQIDINDLDLLLSEIISTYSSKLNEYLKKKL